MTQPSHGAPVSLPPLIVRLRAMSAYGLAGFTALLGLTATGIGALTGISVLAVGLTSALLAIIALAAAGLGPQALAIRTALAACLAGALMLLIAATSPLGEGAVQQAHMMYFVTNAFLIGLVCPTATLTYNVIVVLHHAVLTFGAPALVWHTTAPDTARANLAVHAAIAATLVGPLLLLCRHIMRSAITSDAALQEARAAAAAANVAREGQATAEQGAADARGVALRAVRTRLESALDGIIGSVRATSGIVGEGAAKLAASSRAVDQATAAMLSETDASSQNMALVATAVEQLAASVREVRTQTDAAAEGSQQAAARARAAEATIAELDGSAREIETVIGLISSIAEHTNLLALNATIESARAGEAGKGFAVVAAEVKLLATQTAHATDSISRQIAAMAAKTKDAVAAIGTILQAVSEADQRVHTIADAARHQQDATLQITESVNALAAGTRSNAAQLREVKQDISAVEVQGANLRQAADDLNASVAAARQDADSLLASIAA